MSNAPNRDLTAGKGKTAARLPDTEFLPCGFFVLRTPLLPVEEFVYWSKDLAAPTALSNSAALTRALQDDRRMLSTRLKERFLRDDVAEAVFLASPQLYDRLGFWLADSDPKLNGDVHKIELAAVRYFTRMATRATPFAIFGGHSVGISPDTLSLNLPARSQYQRHTSLDAEYLGKLVGAHLDQPSLQKCLTYRRNPTIYRIAGRLHYIATSVSEKEGYTHRLISAEETPYLRAVLDLALNGCTRAEVAGRLATDEISLSEAQQYADELIASQILIPDHPPSVTGPDPLGQVIDWLRMYPETMPTAQVLDEVRLRLNEMDGSSIGAPARKYCEIVAMLRELPAEVNESKVFRVDLIKPTTKVSIGKALIEEITKGIKLLWRISSIPTKTTLDRFRESFRTRYGEREIPLLEALDDEGGIGFRRQDEPLQLGLSLLDEVPVFPETQDGDSTFVKRDEFLLRQVAAYFRRGSHNLELDPNQLDDLRPRLPLPDTFAVFAVIAAQSSEAIENDQYELILEGVSGPSGARVLGRFCHGDESLQSFVINHLRAEERLRPGVVFAEVCHLPVGHQANIVFRPVFGRYEIPCLGQSGAQRDHQIALGDLLVSVVGARVVLRSISLGCEVLPRLTCAHAYVSRDIPLYRFLGALQSQNVASSFSWDWGKLETLDFLPRVTCGRLILSRARWLLNSHDITSLVEAQGSRQYVTMQEFRARRGLPRYVALREADNKLAIDLDNILSVEGLIQLLARRQSAVIEEILPHWDKCPVQGPEGHFVHELVVPFVHGEARAVTLRHTDSVSKGEPMATRTFPPGSDWLYVKMYMGMATADRVLTDCIAPLVNSFMSEGSIDRWFFVRYADPDWHIRVRLHGIPHRLVSEVLTTVNTIGAEALRKGVIWRIQLDTYEQEVERYGGPASIALMENLFHIDSDATLSLLTILKGEDKSNGRWPIAALGMDSLLGDFGLTLQEKYEFTQEIIPVIYKGADNGKRAKAALAKTFRTHRTRIESLLRIFPGVHLRSGQDSDLLAVLSLRSQRVAPVIAEIKKLDIGGKLVSPVREIVKSVVHMFLNRFLWVEHAKHEIILYDLLAQFYRSELARNGFSFQVDRSPIVSNAEDQ